MATTIITKNGSGAPTEEQLTTGELAVDLTNKELYTKDSGGNVIKVGSQGGSTGTFTDLTATSSFTSPGIDDNATSTAITIDSSENVGIGGSPVSGSRKFMVKDTGDVRVDVRSGSDADLGAIDFSDASNTARGQIVYDHADDSMALKTLSTEQIRITSAGLVGIGTDTPLTALHITQANDPVITLEDTGFGASATLKGSNGNMRIGSTTATIFDMAGSEVMRLDAEGDLGVGTTSSGGGNSYISSTNTMLKVKGNSANKIGSLQLESFGTVNTSVFEVAALDASQGVVMGTMTNGDLSIKTNNSTRMTIDASGQVGIGTDSPSTALQVKGSAGDTLTLGGVNEGTSTANIGGLTLGTSADNVNRRSWAIKSESSQTGTFGIWNSSTNTGAPENLRFVIDASGNVGIGTTLPSEALEVGSGSISINRSGAASPDSHEIKFKVDGSEHASINVENSYNMRFLTNGSERMRITSAGDVEIGGAGKGFATSGTEYISLTATQNFNYAVMQLNGVAGRGGQLDLGAGGIRHASVASVTGSDLAFYTNRTNVGTSVTESMRISASGVLQVGATSQYSGASRAVFGVQSGGTACEMHNSGGTAWTALRFHTSSTLAGYISVGTTTTAYNTSSDERLKENVVDAPTGNIDGIKVRSFDWKVDGSHQEYGFIAQELETVAPYAVSKGETDDDMWAVDYSKLVPMLVKEIQDLKAEVAALKGA